MDEYLPGCKKDMATFTSFGVWQALERLQDGMTQSPKTKIQAIVAAWVCDCSADSRLSRRAGNRSRTVWLPAAHGTGPYEARRSHSRRVGSPGSFSRAVTLSGQRPVIGACGFLLQVFAVRKFSFRKDRALTLCPLGRPGAVVLVDAAFFFIVLGTVRAMAAEQSCHEEATIAY